MIYHVNTMTEWVVMASGWESEDRGFEPWHVQLAFDPWLPQQQSPSLSVNLRKKIKDILF